MPTEATGIFLEITDDYFVLRQYLLWYPLEVLAICHFLLRIYTCLSNKLNL